MSTKKVLIITYYWPPSGGAGVQRWLKMSNYLQKNGVEVHVLVPKPEKASYFVSDESLVDEIHPNIRLHKTDTIEPFGMYKKLFGKKNIPAAGFSNVDPSDFKQKLSIFIRSNLFIPDPRKYWKQFAVKKASQIIKEHNINTIITSSPPHSVQLIGLALKKKLGVQWIADLRDLWTDIYYYPILNHTKLSNSIDKRYEKKVIENADLISTVSPNFIDTYSTKLRTKSKDKFILVPNGFDPKDFQNFNYSAHNEFVITYTGTISKDYPILPFLDALAQFQATFPQKKFKLRFVGVIYNELMAKLEQRALINATEFTGYVSHKESIDYLQKSAALLLLGPLNKNQNEGGIPAKVFEYLASSRPIVYIGKPDGFVADILEKTDGGLTFSEDVPSILKHLEALYQSFENGNETILPNSKITSYSREELAKQFIAHIK